MLFLLQKPEEPVGYLGREYSGESVIDSIEPG